MDAITRKVNALRPEWKKMAHMTGAERHALFTAAPSLAELADADWLLMAEYLAADIPDAKFWQPTGRSKFLDHPSDILALAEKWKKAKPAQTLKKLEWEQ